MKPPYEITNTILDLYGQINQAIGLSKSLLLVKPEAKLRKQNRIRTIYSSLSIEGNTLNIQHISALIDNKKVIGPKNDIIEVQNAIKAYEQLPLFKAHSIKDFLKVHEILMKDLVENPGKFRKSQVGILKGKEVAHIAPSHTMVPGLMHDLFEYLKNDTDMEIIKSCVFHYETEFIHPFEDGNGRMGRYWQTIILMNIHPLFEYVPIEETIKNNQEEYYDVLSKCDKSGTSTLFIEFMLDAINKTLCKTIDQSKTPNIDYQKRIEYILPLLNDWFDRKEYMKLNKGISSATASRDLKRLLAEGLIESIGNGRITKYKKI